MQFYYKERNFLIAEASSFSNLFMGWVGSTRHNVLTVSDISHLAICDGVVQVGQEEVETATLTEYRRHTFTKTDSEGRTWKVEMKTISKDGGVTVEIKGYVFDNGKPVEPKEPGLFKYICQNYHRTDDR